MKCKYLSICSFILALVLMTAVFAGCSSGSKKTNNRFDYGITVNAPDSWDPGIYRLTAEENPEWYDEKYPPLYMVRCDYIGNGEEHVLCSLYVFNAVDWNEIRLGWGDGPHFLEQVKADDQFAYVVSEWPQDGYYEEGTDNGLKFGSMIEYITENGYYVFDKLFVIGATDRKPTATESKSKTVECEFFYFYLNIPTTWEYDDLDIYYEYFDIELEGYEAEYMTRYALKTGPDTSEDLFRAYIFDNEVWTQIEADYEDVPPIAYKIAANDEYTLAALLPQDNPLDRDSDLGKKFDRMQEDIRDFGAFFKMA